MRDRSLLRWLELELWGLVFGVVLFLVVTPFSSWKYLPSLTYLRLSWTGKLTTARVERVEGYVHPQAVYSYATEEGVRHSGRADLPRGAPGDELLVFYLPREPHVSAAREQWLELQQLAIGVLLVLACGTSLVSWRRRARRRPA